MEHPRARPILIAHSTACPLTTGNAPGRPMHTGHTWLLGSAPNAVGQPQNILVAVCSSTCTSMPMTGSKRDTTSVNSMRNNLAEEVRGLAVAVPRNGLEFRDRLVDRDHRDRLAVQRDDLTEVPPVRGVRGVHTEPGRQHAVVRGGGATPLDVSEHGRPDVGVHAPGD